MYLLIERVDYLKIKLSSSQKSISRTKNTRIDISSKQNILLMQLFNSRLNETVKDDIVFQHMQ
jgi:hypothetical protein